jgi:hypothetical protein
VNKKRRPSKARYPTVGRLGDFAKTLKLIRDSVQFAEFEPG